MADKIEGLGEVFQVPAESHRDEPILLLIYGVKHSKRKNVPKRMPSYGCIRSPGENNTATASNPSTRCDTSPHEVVKVVDNSQVEGLQGFVCVAVQVVPASQEGVDHVSAAFSVRAEQ